MNSSVVLLVLVVAAFLARGVAIAQAPTPYPVGLEVCMNTCVTNNDHNIATWVFNGKKTGRGTWSKSASVAILRIDSFEPNDIRIHDENPPASQESGLTAEYRGTLKENRIDGTVTLSWIKFNNPTHSITVPWFAYVPTTICDQTVTAQEGYDIGVKAMQFQQQESAFSCFLGSAKRGNGESKALVGLMYRDHIGIDEANYKESIKWLNEAALQGNYDAQVALWQCYDKGIGTALNPDMAKKWFNTALQNPEMVAKREQREDAIRTQMLQYDLASRVLSSAGSALISAVASSL
jgi:hypothetical protein